MAFIPVDKGVEGIVVWRLNGQKVINTFWFKAAGQPNANDLNQAIAVLKTWWETIAPVMTTVLIFDHIEAHDRTVANGLAIESATTTKPNGEVAGPSAPNSIALVVSHRTGFAGRSARGRTYVGGFPHAYVSGNTITGNVPPVLQGAYDTMRSAAITFGIPMCVASKYHNGAPRPLGVMTPITNFVINTQLDTQRRRMPGYGE